MNTTSVRRIKGWTRAQAEAMLSELQKAYAKAVVAGQSYTIGERTLTRVDEGWLDEQIAKFGDILDAFDGKSKLRFRQFIPFDR